MAALAMIRFPATGDKIGSLVINPGGPGESGIEAALGVVQTLPKRVRERFDLVGFDPRGVGASRPAVWCNSDADTDRLRTEPNVDYSPAGVAHIEDETKQFVARCVAKMGKSFLRNIGTVAVARDLDAIRAALGDDKLTYLGYSYGTRIGSAYAEAYPTARAGDDPRRRRRPQCRSDRGRLAAGQGISGRVQRLRRRLRQETDLPVGHRPGQGHRRLPQPGRPAGRPEQPDARQAGAHQRQTRIELRDAIVGTIMALYSPSLWHHLTDGLTELVDHHGDTLLALADMYMRRDSHGHYSNATDARVAINCVDQPRDYGPRQGRRRRPSLPRDRALHELRAVHRRRAAGHLRVLAGAGDQQAAHRVGARPGADRGGVDHRMIRRRRTRPGSTWPNQLRGSLLTFDGTQHTVVFQGDSCIDDYVTDYLIGGTTPPSGAKC